MPFPAYDELKLEIMTVRVPEGTLELIDKHLMGGELRSVFIRKAVDAELKRRMKFTADAKRSRKMANAS